MSETFKTQNQSFRLVSLMFLALKHYNIHQDNANPNRFITYEVWENQDLMEQHGQSEHFQNFVKVTKDMIEDSNLTQMTRIA